MTTPEQDFAQWRARGDADALGRVFDALAPQLLLVAAHLAGGAAAEDLVQATFVDAIRQRDRWDRSRPLAPWLVGILANHVRMELRRRQRQPVPDAQRLVGNEPATPVETAAANELAEAVRAAVARLPLQYHQVLSLRFVHGLELQQIAHSLRLPLGTVKTRLYRGMAMVKRTLPASLASGLAALMTPGRSLAAVRRAVLGQAATAVEAAAVAVAASGFLFGVITMKRIALAMAVMLAGVGTWFALGTAPGTTPVLVSDVASAATLAVDEPVATTTNPESERRIEASDPASANSRAPSAAAVASGLAGRDQIVIRAIDAGTGAPIEGFGLRAARAPEQSGFATVNPLLHEGVHPDGRLVLDAASIGERVFLVEDTNQRYLPSRWFTLADAFDRNGERTIEVRMPAPVEVTLSVVREHGGTPVAGTKVELARPWPATPETTVRSIVLPAESFRAQADEMEIMARVFSGGRALLLANGTTDTAGRVSLRVPPDEPLALRLLGPGHRPMVQNQWTIAPLPSPVEITFPVTTGAAIQGRFVPKDALTPLRPELPLPGKGITPEFLARYGTGLWLRHAVTKETIPPGLMGLPAPIALGDDGTFAIDGLVAGDWQLFFCYPLRVGQIDPRTAPKSMAAMAELLSLSPMEVELPPILDLHDHELRAFDIDVSALLPGHFEATLTHNGQPVRDGMVVVWAIATPGMSAPRQTPNLRINDGARIVANLPPARYAAHWHVANNRSLPLGAFEVRSGDTTHVDFAVTSVPAEFRVVEADGTTPAPGQLQLQGDDVRAPWFQCERTDASGAVAFPALPRGMTLNATFLRTLPPRGDPAPNQNPAAPQVGASIDLGALPAADGSTTPRILQLPSR